MSKFSIVDGALNHFTNSPTPFHNCANLVTMLGESFEKLSEDEKWEGKIKPNGKYYYTRNTSTLVAFCVGGAYDASNPGGFKVIGGHTDSPNLRIKPCSKNGTSAGKITQLNVECYGGGLWHTWFDRDLSIAGRVIVSTPDGKFTQHLVNLKKPVCRVPSLCIHLQSGDERASFKVNKENHLQPIFAQVVKHTLEAPASKKAKTDEAAGEKNAWREGHDSTLLKLIAEELSIEVAQIADFELALYDTQPAALGGANEEFLYAARLDNQATCYTSIQSLTQYAANKEMLEKDADIAMVCLFDHEEVGSASQCGAGSPIMGEAVRRVSSALNNGGGNEDFFQTTCRRSFVFSVDMAHAIHPNYASKHEKNHSPDLNAGVVIKTNSNQRYTTNAFTGFVIREIGRRKNVPIQEFVVRNDCPCGSTIGPIISEKTGIRCVDAGMPQLSMHSCREMMGTHDLQLCIDLFNGFFELFRNIDESCYLCS
ncbi:hypothetical protein TrST_g8433 [Triparma strigata]|uniref:aspartyl aminopeptidase n=1 Tax=Triparma strigata TaxID=1606541 RepID=A0A9W7AAF3_9STRA|nr:hypothetical protein TrST_g8433 [Triparma strigata]